jgi:peptidoglycan/xylan/chitin deacetylase (PgdA/CDA1 family)
MRTRLTSTAAAVVLAVSALTVPSLVAPSVVAAATPTPSAPMAMRLEAGRHRAYTFNTNGTITGSRAATVSDPATVHSVQRSSIGTRGVFLRMSTGPMAGYWIRESIVAHVIGAVGQRAFTPHRAITLPVGKVLGYRFDTGWNLVSAPVLTVTSASSAMASGSAAINGILYYSIVSGPLASTWVPSGGFHEARELECRTGPKAGGGAAIWSQMTSAGPEVALTFDMGGRTDPAMAIAKRLLLHGVCTTMFPTGDAAQTTPGHDVLEFMDNFPSVFEFGNHTQNHCDLVRGGGGGSCPAGHATADFVKSELNSTNTIVHGITGMSTTPYWRPPYGAHDQAVRIAAAEAGYTKTAMWHIDTIDWKQPPPLDTGPTALQIADKVVNGSGNGTIVLMHLGGWETFDALPSMVNGLRGRGFSVSSVSDLADGS